MPGRMTETWDERHNFWDERRYERLNDGINDRMPGQTTEYWYEQLYFNMNDLIGYMNNLLQSPTAISGYPRRLTTLHPKK